MAYAKYLEPRLNIQISTGPEETLSQPRFCFALGAKRDAFLLTRFTINILRRTIKREACIYCSCAKIIARDDIDFWDCLKTLSREVFWLQNTQQPPLPDHFVFPIVKQDYPLCFDVLAWTLLDCEDESNSSLLHINSGTGYFCTLATYLTDCTQIHGVEFRTDYRQLAQQNVERQVRFNPTDNEHEILPFFHADFPSDLLNGSSKFDRILITECFDDLRKIYSFRCFLNPHGRLVSGFLVERPDGMKISGFATVYQANGSWLMKLHLLSNGYLSRMLNSIRRLQLNTRSRLETARQNPRPVVESAVPSLETLAMRTWSKKLDPLGPLHGELHNKYLMRISPGYEAMPNLSTQLENLTAAFSVFRDRCNATSDDMSPPIIRAVKRDLCTMIIAFESLLKAVIGEDQFNFWKNSQRRLQANHRCCQLPLLNGMMIWLSENIFLIVNFSSYLQCYFFQAASDNSVPNSSILDDNDAFNAVPKVSLTKPLLRAIMHSFRNFGDFFDQKLPYRMSYQLYEVELIERTLTRLAARFLADSSCMVTIVATMITHCSVNKGRQPLCDYLNHKLDNYLKPLTDLFNRVINDSESFTSVEIILRAFGVITPLLKSMHKDASDLKSSCPNTEEMQSLYSCFRYIYSCAQRNPIASQRVWNCRRAKRHLKLLRRRNEEYGLVDVELFKAEHAFLIRDTFQEFIPVAEAHAFLARGMMSDMKEVIWIATSVWAEKWLVYFERNMDMYPRLMMLQGGRPMRSVSELFKLLQRLNCDL